MAPQRIRKTFSGFAPDLQIDLKRPCTRLMPFFPLTRIILLTLDFYFKFLSQIFPKLCALEITGGFLCFRVHHLLSYSVVRSKVGLVWNAFMSFYPIYF